ncbi:hypothetical protein MUK42_19992 [Musa troglodytarum]|uniref:Uncharacterized protein n=1 Tax=Musa troglodytarum TaxID=320322 RepID=A0A9E7FKL9_9LILI|nr:hypothetical protein MUK42_19992 [Musa troglodytarum]
MSYWRDRRKKGGDSDNGGCVMHGGGFAYGSEGPKRRMVNIKLYNLLPPFFYGTKHRLHL